MKIYVHKAQFARGELLIVKVIEGQTVEQLTDWRDTHRGNRYDLFKKGDLEELFIEVETDSPILHQICESDVSALKFITSETSAATIIPEVIKFSREDVEAFDKLKKEIASKSPEELHREAQERWNK